MDENAEKPTKNAQPVAATVQTTPSHTKGRIRVLKHGKVIDGSCQEVVSLTVTVCTESDLES
jgi:cytidine deaminase